MELESIRQFGEAQEEIRNDVKHYEPGETGYEAMSAQERFDGLWNRFDALAAASPWYDGLDRSVIELRDLKGLNLRVQRSLGEPIRPFGYDERSRTPRFIVAVWTFGNGEVVTESHSDEDHNIADNSRIRNALAALEETELAAIKIIEEVNEVISRPSRVGSGHP